MVRVAFTPAPPCTALRSISTDSKALFTSNATSPLMSERPPVRAARPPPLLRRVPGFCARQGTHAVSGEAHATRSHTRSHAHPSSTPHSHTMWHSVHKRTAASAVRTAASFDPFFSTARSRGVRPRCGAMASVTPPPTPHRYSHRAAHAYTQPHAHQSPLAHHDLRGRTLSNALASAPANISASMPGTL